MNKAKKEIVRVENLKVHFDLDKRKFARKNRKLLKAVGFDTEFREIWKWLTYSADRYTVTVYCLFVFIQTLVLF